MTEKEVYNYVMTNAAVKYLMNKSKYTAYITLLGIDHQEYGDGPVAARNKLAEELSKSKYIQNNLKP